MPNDDEEMKSPLKYDDYATNSDSQIDYKEMYEKLMLKHKRASED